MKNILVIDNESKHTKDIAKLFPRQKITVCLYNKIPDTKKFDLIVLSGGSHHSIFHKPNPYIKELKLIRQSKTPILGICLGCQLIGLAFGAEFYELSQKIVKTIEINYLDKKKYKVFETHRYAIKTLGEKLLGIAKSKYGYEIIKHKSKPIRGFQFHPEVDMQHTQGKKIVKEIMNLMF